MKTYPRVPAEIRQAFEQEIRKLDHKFASQTRIWWDPPDTKDLDLPNIQHTGGVVASRNVRSEQIKLLRLFDFHTSATAEVLVMRREQLLEESLMLACKAHNTSAVITWARDDVSCQGFSPFYIIFRQEKPADVHAEFKEITERLATCFRIQVVPELRVDPHDNKQYSYLQFLQMYQKRYTQEKVRRYWNDVCKLTG